MLLTLTWPAKTPSTSTTKGYVVPSLAAFFSRRTRARNVVGRASPPGGTVASQGESQIRLRLRTSRQAEASPTRSGRSVTRGSVPDISVFGHALPGIELTIRAVNG